MNNEKIINEFKYYIDNQNYNSIYELYTDITTSYDLTKEYRCNYEYIFQKVYLYACIKGETEVINFMKSIYDNFGIVEKIALKPTIIYGKYITKKT